MRPIGAVRILSALAFTALVVTTGCDDNFGPDYWEAIPDTVDLFSLNRSAYQGMPTGFSLLADQFAGRHGQRVIIEVPGASGNWDFALVEENDRLLLLPAGAYPALDIGAGIGPLPGETFESVDRVPGNPGIYQDSVAVAVEVGQVYAVRSRNYYAYGGQSCALYGKLSPISIDSEEGVLRFEIVRNPTCNDRSMVPPKKK